MGYEHDLRALIDLIERLALEQADGHWTLYKFTTGYKATLGTPDAEGFDREWLFEQETFPTAEAALVDLILTQRCVPLSLPPDQALR